MSSPIPKRPDMKTLKARALRVQELGIYSDMRPVRAYEHYQREASPETILALPAYFDYLEEMVRKAESAGAGLQRVLRQVATEWQKDKDRERDVQFIRMNGVDAFLNRRPAAPSEEIKAPKD